MKKLLFSFIAILAISLTIVSCGSKSDPKSVAKSFLEARNKMDYEAAKKFGTPETGKMLDMLASFSSMIPDSVKNLTKNAKVEIKGEPKIEGEKCTITAATTIGTETKDETVNLVMKDKKWLVNMSKDDMGGGAGTEAPADATAVPAEEAMPVAADTTTAAH